MNLELQEPGKAQTHLLQLEPSLGRGTLGHRHCGRGACKGVAGEHQRRKAQPMEGVAQKFRHSWLPCLPNAPDCGAYVGLPTE